MTAHLSLDPVWTGAQIRAAERPLLEAGHGPELMRRASWGLAGVVLKILRERVVWASSGASRRSGGLRTPQSAHTTSKVYGARVTGLIGPGNNGGDGLYALAFLRRRGADARAVLLSDRIHEDALAAFLRAGGRVAEEIPQDTEVLLDAVLGTGVTTASAAGRDPLVIPGLETFLERGEAADRSGAAGSRPVVVACDLPSGVDAGTGEFTGACPQIPADHTVTFGGLKIGLLAGDGGRLSGQLHTVDIGIGEHLPEPQAHAVREGEAARPAPPQAAGHKYSRGVVHILAGSQQYPGAAQLTVGAAVRTGVGMVTFEGPEEVRRQVLADHPEAVHRTEKGRDGLNEGLKKARAVVAGPGLGEDPALQQAAADAVRWAVQRRLPCVVDASALSLVPQLRLRPEVLLTPHLGEARALAERLGDDDAGRLLPSDPVGAARLLARRIGATILLKGATTVIATPEGESILHRADTPGLATAGSGDVLSGILGTVLATQSEHLPVPQCAALAVRIHAEAAGRLDPDGLGRFGASALLEGLGSHG